VADRDPLNTLRLIFAVVALLAWAASVTLFLFAGQPVDPWVHIITAAIATALFGPEIWNRSGRSR
jgi:hypothetical protein